MSEEIPFDELKDKYPEIIEYKLGVDPHPRWMFVRVCSQIKNPFSHHEIVIFKDEKGKVLAFWKGKHRESYFFTLECSQNDVNIKRSTSVYGSIRSYMNNLGFTPYP